jgi:hypothetical protein
MGRVMGTGRVAGGCVVVRLGRGAGVGAGVACSTGTETATGEPTSGVKADPTRPYTGSFRCQEPP